jgi:hypothetical protein
MAWDNAKKAAVAVGVTAGFLAAGAGAPLWAAVLAGSGGAVATPKAIDALAKLLGKA